MASKEYFDNAIRKVNEIVSFKELDDFRRSDIKHRFSSNLDFKQKHEMHKLIDKRLEELDKRMTLEEFNSLYRQSDKQWKFDLFKIQCVKCGSDRVEFNGNMEYEGGYYLGEYSVRGNIVIKCHSCGNAFTLNFDDLSKD